MSSSSYTSIYGSYPTSQTNNIYNLVNDIIVNYITEHPKPAITGPTGPTGPGMVGPTGPNTVINQLIASSGFVGNLTTVGGLTRTPAYGGNYIYSTNLSMLSANLSSTTGYVDGTISTTNLSAGSGYFAGTFDSNSYLSYRLSYTASISSSVAVSVNGGPTLITMTVTSDTTPGGTMVSVANRITIRQNGIYTIDAGSSTTDIVSATNGILYIYINGVEQASSGKLPYATVKYISLQTTWKGTVGDYIELYYSNTPGSPYSVSGRLIVLYCGLY